MKPANYCSQQSTRSTPICKFPMTFPEDGKCKCSSKNCGPKSLIKIKDTVELLCQGTKAVSKAPQVNECTVL